MWEVEQELIMGDMQQDAAVERPQYCPNPHAVQLTTYLIHAEWEQARETNPSY
jgi:hypothetical protein